MPKIISVAFCLFFATLSSLSHSEFFCQEGPCDIQLSYANGGELTANQAIISFGEGASIQLGESGSYDLGLSGFIYDSDITDLNAQTAIPAGTKVYLGKGAKLIFSNYGYLNLGEGGNIETLSNTEININGISSINNNGYSGLSFELQSNENADYLLYGVFVKLDYNDSQKFKVLSDSLSVHSNQLSVSTPLSFHTKSFNIQIPMGTNLSSSGLYGLQFEDSYLTPGTSGNNCEIESNPCDSEDSQSTYNNCYLTEVLCDDTAATLISDLRLCETGYQQLANYSDVTLDFFEESPSLSELLEQSASSEDVMPGGINDLNEAQSALDNFTYGQFQDENNNENVAMVIPSCINTELKITDNNGSGGTFLFCILLSIGLIGRKPR